MNQLIALCSIVRRFSRIRVGVADAVPTSVGICFPARHASGAARRRDGRP
jgi:hypothetical protein